MMAPVRVIVVCIAFLVACGGKGEGTTANRTKLKAAVLGLARDTHTGEPVAMADIELIGPSKRKTLTNKNGLYTIDGLAAGTYTLKGVFAGQPVQITKIPVHDGEAVYVDLMFTLGDPQPILVVFGDRSAEITRYRPKNIQPSAILIEGTVSDVQTRERVIGAVVTAVYTDAAKQMHTEQTITDDHGRHDQRVLLDQRTRAGRDAARRRCHGDRGGDRAARDRAQQVDQSNQNRAPMLPSKCGPKRSR
jgi:hypothetical protein